VAGRAAGAALAVVEDRAHRLHGAAVDEEGLAVALEVGVAAVDGALDVGGRQGALSGKVEGEADVEPAAGGLGDLHDGRDDGQGVDERGEAVGEGDFPAAAGEGGVAAAEEVERFTHADERVGGRGGGIIFLKTVGTKEVDGGVLGGQVADAVAQRVVGVGDGELGLGVGAAGGEGV